METIYDWAALALFAALVLLLLQRSAMRPPPDRLWHYLPPALACALANWLGNEGHDGAAIALLVASAAYIAFVLKPFAPR